MSERIRPGAPWLNPAAIRPSPSRSVSADAGEMSDPSDRHFDDVFDDMRAETIRTRSRWIWAAAIVVWLTSFALVDAAAFPTRQAAFAVRAPEIVLAVAMFVWLRRPRKLVAIEIATVVAWAAIAALSAHGLAVVPEDKLPMKVASLVLSVLLVCPLGSFTWRSTAGAGIVTVLALGGLPMRGAVALYQITLTVIGFAYVVLIVSAFTRDRLKRTELATRTALAAANARLKREDEARRRLFVGLSHDFRTPLAIIRGEADALTEAIDGAASKDALHRIERSARALTDITEQILELARIEAGQAPVRPRSCDVASIARDVAAQLAPKNGRIVVSNDTDAAIARVDPHHAYRILANLVGNAVRQLGEEVRITLRTEDERVIVDVADDGPGIAESRREAIFQRFVSFDADGGTASGIGLPLARELAELNAGSLALVDGARSTTFRLTLPASHAPAEEGARMDHVPSHVPLPTATPDQAPMPSAAAETTSTEATRPHILLVEDHPDMAALLTRTLAPRFAVIHASSTKAALEELDARPPDAIVSDVLLPDGTGYDVLGVVRRTPKLAHVPVMMVSALGEVEERIRGIAEGADDYLAKPFAPKELLARVASLVTHAEGRKHALRAERDALLMEIHDGVSGSLARASMLLAARRTESVDHAREAIRDGLEEVRALTRLLSPQSEDWSVVTAAIRRAMSDACAASSIDVTFAADDLPAHAVVTGPVAHTLRRIAREATTNVVKHAGASKVRCTMTARPQAWTLRIEDDGRGFPSTVDGGHGLGIMRRRVERLGGTLAHGNVAGGAFVEATIARV